MLVVFLASLVDLPLVWPRFGGLVHGLRIASRLGFSNFLIEMDSVVVVT